MLSPPRRVLDATWGTVMRFTRLDGGGGDVAVAGTGGGGSGAAVVARVGVVARGGAS